MKDSQCIICFYTKIILVENYRIVLYRTVSYRIVLYCIVSFNRKLVFDQIQQVSVLLSLLS